MAIAAILPRTPDSRVGEAVHVPGVVEDNVVVRGDGVPEWRANGTNRVANDHRWTAQHHHDEHAHQEPPEELKENQIN